MMPRRRKNVRVAIATTQFTRYEQAVVRGVISYRDHADHWRFYQQHEAPYAKFDDIDLSQVDAVIGGFYEPAWVAQVKQAGIIAVNTSNSRESIDLPRVGTGDLAIGQMGANHLLERGYCHFGFLTRDNNWYSHRRLEGFREVIEDNASRTCHVYPPSSSKTPDDERPIARWLDALPKPIGIMAANDIRGRQLIDAAVTMGLRVPEDVGVLGVDNDEFASALAARPLSSIELHGHETGYRAAQILDALLAGEKPHSPLWIQPLRVVTRRSTDVTISQDEVVSKALQFIREHSGEPITVSDVLKAVDVSQTSLEVRMKQAIGKTPHVAINSAKIERARKLLNTTAMTIGQVAQQCGYTRQERFNVVFKRITGMTPSQFRQQRSA